MEGRRRRGRPRPRWEDCVKRDLVGMEWRMRVRDGGSGDASETGLVMKKKGKQKSTTCIGASLTLDYRDKEESNNISAENLPGFII